MDNVPLCVDLDGTLVRTNTLLETALGALKKNPLFIFSIVRALFISKAQVKHRIGQQFSILESPLPYNEEFLAWIKKQHEAGRRLILATASDKAIAVQIAKELGIFDDVIASTPQLSITANGKYAVLCQLFGTNGFSYAGNSKSDLAVWNCAKSAIVVDAPYRISSRIRKNIPVEKVFTTQKNSTIRVFAKTMRIHQWVKNVLLFVPPLAAHEIAQPLVAFHALFGFISFSLLASAVYMFNDIADIGTDRMHSTKKYRPIASGQISLKQSIALGSICVFASIVLSLLFLPASFLGILAIYLAINICYSLFAKKIAYLDILILAGLYVLRIFAGSFATGISTSKWLFIWTLFFFLSLAIVKRVIELLRLNDTLKKAHGRGYHKNDLEILKYTGIASATASIIILAMYIRSSSIFVLYANPLLLWIVVVLVAAWLARIWTLALQQKLPDDPVLFAAKDPVSYAAVLAVIATMLLAS
ncbi:MAG TPA: UbiA family prenyltransferase [Candidatus Andersenbacteria bacterium]|nr:UbiA family prenyltransferase [Candidatus Andersenbacteria bacterium]